MNSKIQTTLIKIVEWQVVILAVAGLLFLAVATHYWVAEGNVYDTIYAEQEASYLAEPAGETVGHPADADAIVSSRTDWALQSDPRVPSSLPLLVLLSLMGASLAVVLGCAIAGLLFTRSGSSKPEPEPALIPV